MTAAPLRVLVLSQHFWPESFRINEVVQGLREAGCDVTVLTGQPNYPGGTIFKGYRASGMGQQTMPDGTPVFRVPLVPRGAARARQMAMNYLSFLGSACLLGPWLLRGRRFDVIFVYGTSPILQAIAGVWLKWIKRCPLVTWVQDLWPQSLEVTGYVRNPRVLAAVATVVRWIYRRSDLLLGQSVAFEPVLREMAPGIPTGFFPNPGETAFADGLPAAPVPLTLNAEAFNVVFAGNLGTVQALETVLDAAELLQEHPNIRFVLVGSGNRSAWLAQEKARRGLTHVELPGRYGERDMPGILGQASALLVSLNRSPILALTVPAKIQAYLAVGRPIVASLDGEGARVVMQAGAGIACPAEDARALADAVLALVQATPAQRQAMGEAGRRFYQQEYEPRMLMGRLAGILSGMARKGSRA